MVAGALSEYEAKQILLAAGIEFLPEKLAVSTAEAAGFAAEFKAKVAMKIVSPDILHKTEIGGVILNVPDEQAAGAAYETLLARAQAAAPQARITGVLIAPMAGEGVETIIGVARDPVFGPVVMFGIGGVLVELMKDVTFRLAPFDKNIAHEMICEIKGFPLLQGFRGAPPADIDALAAALAALSHFAAANANWVESIDLNPFLVRPAPQGAVALDAAIVTL
jgi:succinyl-CoA synthetase beta subunit